LTHGIGGADFDTGSREFEAVTQIHQWVNAPGTITLGYNTLNFDDEFLRFSFYRNLLPPYTHQYDKGCMRMDLYPITIAFWLYRPEVMEWPQVDGEVSLTLEHLNAANGFADGPSHDAMTDTAAALGLAQRLIGERDMWNYLSGYFHKTTDRLRVDRLPGALNSPDGPHRKGLMLNGEFGTKNGFQIPVLSMGPSEAYTNQTLWLRLDTAKLGTTTIDSIPETTWAIRKKLGEPGLLLPPHERYWQRLDPSRQALARENMQWIEAHPRIFGEIVRYHREYRYPEVPDVDADAALYDLGFLSRQEQDLSRRFHLASLAEKIAMIQDFPRAVLRELAERALLRNFGDELPRKLSRKFPQLMRRANPGADRTAAVDYKGEPRLTPRAALTAIDALKQTADLSGVQIELMDALAVSIRDRFGLTDDP
jgi:exodeoxyribonuclease-1